jgi:hypothetical protein
MTTTESPNRYHQPRAERPCTRCEHRNDAHTAGELGACTAGSCECRWYAVDPRTGR